MSKSVVNVVKKVAKIALPVVGGFIGGPIGAAVGGAAAGALGGGGVTGALIGGASGYLGSSVGSSLLGKAAGTSLDVVSGVAGAQGPTYGSGLVGLATGGGVRALTSGLTAGSAGQSLLGIGNQLLGNEGEDAALKAANLQSESVDRALKAQKKYQQEQQATLQPYVDYGNTAAQQVQQIQADPAGYIQNDPLYNTLADDAQRRLFANQATKGKLGSGETKAALQDRLLTLGNDLLQQRVGSLQNQVTTGANAAAGVGSGYLTTGANLGNLETQQGNAQAAGVVGGYNAQAATYNNQINTLLALQNLNKVPQYTPTLNL